MIIRFDVNGEAIPDAKVEQTCREQIAAQQDIHISTACAFNWCRAILLQTPPTQRPPLLDWIVGDEVVKMDEDFRYKLEDKPAKLLEVEMEACCILLDGHKGQKWYKAVRQQELNEIREADYANILVGDRRLGLDARNYRMCLRLNITTLDELLRSRVRIKLYCSPNPGYGENSFKSLCGVLDEMGITWKEDTHGMV